MNENFIRGDHILDLCVDGRKELRNFSKTGHLRIWTKDMSDSEEDGQRKNISSLWM